ncbi:MAG: ion channel [Myxococcales bacterium]|nr:ion channel [Myxococcales bacterium]
MTSSIRRIPRNAALLSVLLLLIVFSPSVPEALAGFLVELTFALLLLAGVYSVGPGKHRWAFWILTTVTLAARWVQLLAEPRALRIAALVLTVVWIGYAISITVSHLFQRRDVTLNTIFGAIVAYLLIAVAFAILFEIILLGDPGAFSGIPEGVLGQRSKLGDAMIYFSLVCLTTMGFGDIVPVSSIARPLAVLEGVFGQLYLAVMIARLVGLHIVSEGREDG